MIVHLPSGKWQLRSKDGDKVLGTYDTYHEVLAAERRAVYFGNRTRQRRARRAGR